ncbi:heavy metal-binding domain-containing protein [Leeuwenhoekiella sp. A16]|uniref:heavy metal-binding domain-containing protein n=1 Tax=Leeuwenhoekiella sp. A16 TaxID=3141462 RepID=UPI003A7FF938
MLDFEKCPNCDAAIKKTTFSSNELLSANDTAIINEYNSEKKTGYCNKCSLKPFKESVNKLKSEITQLKTDLRTLIKYIPILTIQNLPGWNYKILDMVTGQSTTGTGAITEFTSSFTDFFGVQSNRHNSKIKAGEELCQAQLRTFAYEMGGNAVIGADIDYSDSGDGKGMLIVCMSGTAILAEESCFSASQQKGLALLKSKRERLNYLRKFKLYVVA